ncbi:DUF4153 domain-containing protein [Nocardiopsis ganjiahuensis]|uniref:DUF4153 domain-containing protein n=1 Tax=Nocardiopsis ganjiahuensis TaxID=239984 RepID=UPI00034A3322|nr:DUF4173 domain-containing protein [Nocardiopsis ganjiahuensis]
MSAEETDRSVRDGRTGDAEEPATPRSEPPESAVGRPAEEGPEAEGPGPEGPEPEGPDPEERPAEQEPGAEERGEEDPGAEVAEEQGFGAYERRYDALRYAAPPPRPRAPLPEAPVWLPLAVFGVGVLGLFLATFDRPGIGLVITGLAAGLTAFTALLVRPSIPESAEDGADGSLGEDPEEGTGDSGEEADGFEDRTGPDRYRHAWSAVYGVLATALLATAALRDAGWVLTWTLTAAFFLASLAFAVHNPAARHSTVGAAAGSVALLRNAFAVPVFLGRPLVRFKASNRALVPALVTTGTTLGLLVVFGGLFAFADPVFAAHVENLFSAPDLSVGGLHPIGALLAALFTGAAVLAARRGTAPRRPVPGSVTPRATPPGFPVPAPDPEASAPPWPVWVWTVPLGALAALFTAFLAVQATAMFGGDEYVQRVAGVIYAEYARQGFFQLVVVSLLVLGVVALVVRLVPGLSGTRLLRNSMLGALCFLTLVILASAMMRLQLYIDVFGLTRLRVAAEAWIVWSALLFVLILVAGVLDSLGRRTRWLPRAAVALGAVALTVFAYSDPDLRIAESHHDLDLAEVDTWYLRGLSADAVPGLIELEGDDRGCALDRIGDRLRTADGFGAGNLSRERARSLLAEHDLLGSSAPEFVDRSHCAAPYFH